MPAFFLTFMACLLVTAAGRDQLRVARLAAGLGPGAGLFAAIWISSFATCALAAWLGTLLGPSLVPAAKQMFVALALALAAMELLLLRARPAPAEPTRSAGAILIVLVSSQLADAARFLVIALCLQTGEPYLAAAGGALGSGIALCAGAIAAGEWEKRVPIRMVKRVLAGILLVIAALIALSARGIIG